MQSRCRLRLPPLTTVAPVTQHRGRDPQLVGNLQQRPTAARQQRDRLRLELIRKLTSFLTHSTPSRSSRSLAKVSINPGEAHSRLRRENDRLRMERDILKKAVAIFSEPPR